MDPQCFVFCQHFFRSKFLNLFVLFLNVVLKYNLCYMSNLCVLFSANMHRKYDSHGHAIRTEYGSYVYIRGKCWFDHMLKKTID